MSLKHDIPDEGVGWAVQRVVGGGEQRVGAAPLPPFGQQHGGGRGSQVQMAGTA